MKKIWIIGIAVSAIIIAGLLAYNSSPTTSKNQEGITELSPTHDSIKTKINTGFTTMGAYK